VGGKTAKKSNEQAAAGHRGLVFVVVAVVVAGVVVSHLFSLFCLAV
jgi:hypothetical protein